MPLWGTPPGLLARLFRPRPKPSALSGIPTPVYERMIADLCADGWARSAAYGGFDAGIDYDSVMLRKQGVTLKFEWERYFEGEVWGPNTVLENLRGKYLGATAEEEK